MKTRRFTQNFLHSLYMEGFGTSFFSDWKAAASNLLWAQTNFHVPVITALEGWYSKDRNDCSLMRALTTLSLTHSNGYVLFGDPNPLTTPDHLHDWYPFWDKSLGRAIGPIGEKVIDGSFRREFENGTAIFNPPSNKLIQTSFEKVRKSAATGKVGRVHMIAPGDGDLFLKN